TEIEMPTTRALSLLPLRGELVELFRIVDEERLALRLVCELADEIDQPAVVRDRVEVGMRPVAAPDDAVAEVGHQLARERHGVRVGRALARGALEAAHLD